MNHPARFIREKIVSLIAIMNRMIKFREEKSGNETFSYDVSVRFSDGNRVHLGGEIKRFFFFLRGSLRYPELYSKVFFPRAN